MDRREAEAGIKRLEPRDRVHEEVFVAAALHEFGHDAAGVPPPPEPCGREDGIDLAAVGVAPAHGERAEGPISEEPEDPIDGRVAPGPVVVAPDLGGARKLGPTELADREPGLFGDQRRVTSYWLFAPAWLMAGRLPSAAILNRELVTGFSYAGFP